MFEYVDHLPKKLNISHSSMQQSIHILNHVMSTLSSESVGRLSTTQTGTHNTLSRLLGRYLSFCSSILLPGPVGPDTIRLYNPIDF